MPISPADTWQAGDAYERYVGRWSRLVAREFLAWLDAPAGGRWLDVGCGTGALTEAVLAYAAPAAVVGVDPSTGFVDHAAAHVTDPRASFRIGDARELPVGDAEFDAVVSGLSLNFVPDQPRAVAEARRAVRAGGLVAAYVWDYLGGMELMRHFWDAAVELDPAARELHEGLRFESSRPEALAALFADAGLADVAVEGVVVPTHFADFADYWSGFLGGQGPGPAYTMALDEERRAALREALRARVPADADGAVRLTARAWAVRGTRP